MAWLWQQLTSMYGSTFLREHAVRERPDDECAAYPAKLWIGALSKLTLAEAKLGIVNLSKERRSWPPNLTEVLDACRPKSAGVRFLGVPERKRLPIVPARIEHVDACLARMRQVLGRTREPGEDDEPSRPRAETRATTPACTCKGKGECETCQGYLGLMKRLYGEKPDDEDAA